MPTPETLSHQDLGPILDKLQLLLENLPNQLPSKPVSGPDASRYVLLDGLSDEDVVNQTLRVPAHVKTSGINEISIDEAFDNW